MAPIPKISVIIPVYNTEKFLQECLNSVVNQTLKDIEIICVNDASTDGSLNILREYADKDKRIQIIDFKKGEGVYRARNIGIEKSKGEYIAFVDSDDWVDLDFYEKLYFIAQQKQADLVRACTFQHFLHNQIRPFSLNKKLIERKGNQLHINDHDVVVWDAIYKSSVVKKNNFVFLTRKMIAHEDILWTAQLTYYAKRAFACTDTFYHYRCTETNTLKSKTDSTGYVNSKTLEFINSVPYPSKEDYLEAVGRCFWRYIYHFNMNYTNPKFSKQNRLDFLKFWVKDWILLRDKEIIYERHPQTVLSKQDWFNLSEEELFIKLSKECLRPVIVSLTSYPARISTCYQVIESLLNQTVKVDKIILWLAVEEFPNKEKDLPAELLQLTEKGLVIDWYHNIKSYKKLIPALQKYPEAVIITVDDDAVYQDNVVEKLLNAYIWQPKMIHALRVHKITFKHGKMAPYKEWPSQVKWAEPSYNNFFTGVGGVLYPPNVLDEDVLSEKKFIKLAPNADDIWFWAMAVRKGTKINLVSNEDVSYMIIPRSQSSCLWLDNKNNNGNDRQLSAVFNAYPDILEKLDKTNPFGRVRICIPIFGYKRKQENLKIKLFGLPVFQIKCKKDKSVKRFLILGLCILKLKKKK